MILFVNSDFSELDVNSYIIECVSQLQNTAPDNYKQITFSEMTIPSKCLDNKYIIGMVSQLKINDSCFKEQLILGEIATLTQEKTITLEFVDDYKNLSQVIHIGDFVMLYNFRLESLKNTYRRGRRPANLLPYKITSAFEGFKLYFMSGNPYKLNDIHDRMEIQKFNLQLSDYENSDTIKQIIRDTSNTFQESCLFSQDICIDDLIEKPTQSERKKHSQKSGIDDGKAEEQERQLRTQRIRGFQRVHAEQKAASKKSSNEEENNALIDEMTDGFSNESINFKSEIKRVTYIRDLLFLAAKKDRQKSKSKLQISTNNLIDFPVSSKTGLTSIKNIKPKSHFNLECQVLGVLVNENSNVHCILMCWDGTKRSIPCQSPSKGQWNPKFKDNEINLLNEYSLFINVFGEHVIQLHTLRLHQLIRITNIYAKLVGKKLMCDLNVGGMEFQRGLQKMKENTQWSKALENRLWRSRSAIQIHRHLRTFRSDLSKQGKEYVAANDKKIAENLDISSIIDNCDHLLTIFSSKLSQNKKISSNENAGTSNHTITANDEENELIIMDDHEANEQTNGFRIENIYSLSNQIALEMWNQVENYSDPHSIANNQEFAFNYETEQITTKNNETASINYQKLQPPVPIGSPCNSLKRSQFNSTENIDIENLESVGNLEIDESLIVPETWSIAEEMRNTNSPEILLNETLYENNQANARQREDYDTQNNNKRPKADVHSSDNSNSSFELNRISRITAFQGKFSSISELNSAADQQLCSFQGVILDIYPRSDHVIDAFKLSCRRCKNTFPINDRRQQVCKVSGCACDVTPSLHFKLRLCDSDKALVDVIIRDENAEKFFWGNEVDSLRSTENLKLLSNIVKKLCRFPAHLSPNSYVLFCNVKVSVERRNKRNFYLQDTVLECGGESHQNY